MLIQVCMDHKWMLSNRLSDEYEVGVKYSVSFVVQCANNLNSMLCPCLDCCHGLRVNPLELEEHLVCNGIDKDYMRWTNHGESIFDSSDAMNILGCASVDMEKDECE